MCFVVHVIVVSLCVFLFVCAVCVFVCLFCVAFACFVFVCFLFCVFGLFCCVCLLFVLFGLLFVVRVVLRCVVLLCVCFVCLSSFVCVLLRFAMFVVLLCVCCFVCVVVVKIPVVDTFLVKGSYRYTRLRASVYQVWARYVQQLGFRGKSVSFSSRGEANGPRWEETGLARRGVNH